MPYSSMIYGSHLDFPLNGCPTLIVEGHVIDTNGGDSTESFMCYVADSSRKQLHLFTVGISESCPPSEGSLTRSDRLICGCDPAIKCVDMPRYQLYIVIINIIITIIIMFIIMFIGTV